MTKSAVYKYLGLSSRWRRWVYRFWTLHPEIFKKEFPFLGLQRFSVHVKFLTILRKDLWRAARWLRLLKGFCGLGKSSLGFSIFWQKKENNLLSACKFKWLMVFEFGIEANIFEYSQRVGSDENVAMLRSSSLLLNN